MGEEVNPADARNRGDASPGLKGTEEPFWAGVGGSKSRHSLDLKLERPETESKRCHLQDVFVWPLYSST